MEESTKQTEEKVEEETKRLKEELESLRKEKDELYDKYLRLNAEFENFRKRMQKEAERFKELANEAIIKELLLVVDNFERALQSAEGGSTEGFVEGVKLIYKQLKDVLSRFGVEEIEAVDREFDPNLHEAIMQVDHEEKDNIVVQEVQKGYKLKGKLIRPSKVVVARKKA